MVSLGRNDPCPCGSGRKYKQCCLNQDGEIESGRLAEAASHAKMMQSAQLHQQAGRLVEAESLCLQILEANPNHSDALHLLGKIAIQVRQFGIAAELLGKLVEIQPSAMAHCDLGSALLGLGQLDEASVNYRQALAKKPDHAESLYNLGVLLQKQGNPDEAVASYRKAIAVKQGYLKAHLNLSSVFRDLGKLDEAISSCENVLAIDPNHVEAHFCLGDLYRRARQLPLAEECYRKVLDIAPDLVPAHMNLAGILNELRRNDEAQHHRSIAFKMQCAIVMPPSKTAVRTVLLIFESGRGNIPLGFLTSSKENNLIELIVEYAKEEQFQKLPPYDVVFNAIGDPDVASSVTQPLARFVSLCEKPILNPPDRVARTARYMMPDLLKDVEGILAPDVWRIEQEGNWYDNPGFQFPVLVRPLSSQGGQGLVLAEDRDALSRVVPYQGGGAHVCNYHDYRSADGYFRKYRIFFVDRQPYPYHLAISSHWMVHYQTADMPSHQWKLEEELRFLENPAGVLGERGMNAIKEIGKRLDLDYAGVDFSILPDGRLLIFEANATMLAHLEDGEALNHKNPYIQKIFDAFAGLLARVSGKPSSIPVSGQPLRELVQE